MSRLVNLSEAKIQELEQFDSAHMGAFIMQVGTQKAAETFVAALRSYRIAASVANIAWKAVKEAEAGGITGETFQNLQKALALYAPAHFRPFRGDIEFTCRSLEELYDSLTPYNAEGMSTMVLMEQIFDRICQLRAVLDGA